MPDYDLVEMEPERGKELTDKIQALLQEYDAEMGVKTEIHIWARKPKPILSPAEFQPGNNNDGESTTA